MLRFESILILKPDSSAVTGIFFFFSFNAQFCTLKKVKKNNLKSSHSALAPHTNYANTKD